MKTFIERMMTRKLIERLDRVVSILLPVASGAAIGSIIGIAIGYAWRMMQGF